MFKIKTEMTFQIENWNYILKSGIEIKFLKTFSQFLFLFLYHKRCAFLSVLNQTTLIWKKIGLIHGERNHKNEINTFVYSSQILGRIYKVSDPKDTENDRPKHKLK